MQGLERCAGCGHFAKVADGGHPWVAVMGRSNAEKLGFMYPDDRVSARGFVNVPVCAACHQDPAHRVFPIKGAFFLRQDANAATTLAGINEVLMPLSRG